MTTSAYRTFAIIAQVIYFAAIVISLFLPKGDLKTGLNIGLLIFGLGMIIIAVLAKIKQQKIKKNLKRVRDELREKRWEEEHRI